MNRNTISYHGLTDSMVDQYYEKYSIHTRLTEFNINIVVQDYEIPRRHFISGGASSFVQGVTDVLIE